jgi:hypothetical protein
MTSQHYSIACQWLAIVHVQGRTKVSVRGCSKLRLVVTYDHQLDDSDVERSKIPNVGVLGGALAEVLDPA